VKNKWGKLTDEDQSHQGDGEINPKPKSRNVMAFPWNTWAKRWTVDLAGRAEESPVSYAVPHCRAAKGTRRYTQAKV